jgi:hypothetical protein
MVRIPRKDDPRDAPGSNVATEDAGVFRDRAPVEVDAAQGVEWYDEPGNAADAAAYTLCRLRRASAGIHGGPVPGDEAVRAALTDASPEAVVWIASRAISYLDESGFAEAVEPWIVELDTLADPPAE